MAFKWEAFADFFSEDCVGGGRVGKSIETDRS